MQHNPASLDLDALRSAQLQHSPCDFVVVPRFVRPEAFDAIYNDYPEIQQAGNFIPQDLQYGKAFSAFLEDLNSTQLKEVFAEKFGMDLTPNPLQLTVRKYSELSDGNVHNDSKTKLLTTLVYLNKEWKHPDGRLRLLNNSWNIEDYVAKVEPANGTLITFRRSEKSFHGFKKMQGERRSIQMYYVKPKRKHKDDASPIGLKRQLKRILKLRPRWLGMKK
ncbi:MAG: 2OG-Fe(II) oxygenase [gamma proteobacterium symbiont of Bathyaustriella thionipta]|nr:2OG-Fe(II) oxygenase [gamma proteobacterium symbiont of Bathyaustriella thionipta]